MNFKSLKPKICSALLSLLLLWISSLTLFSNPYYDNNSNIRLAHQQIYALRILACEKLLQEEELKNPLNGYVTYYRIYSEIMALIISNSPEEFRKRKPLLDHYLNKLKELPDNTPDYKLLLGEANVFMGVINIEYDNEFSGFIDCLRGYRLLEKNAKEYPSFEPDDKMLGLIDIGVSFLPRILQRGAKLFNITGNPQEGHEKAQ